MTQKRKVTLEPGGLSVPVGSRTVYLFQGRGERTRFAPFIAAGLAEGDKCALVTDLLGRDDFFRALRALGVDPEANERKGSLAVITSGVSVDSLTTLAPPILEDAEANYRDIRCINDLSRKVQDGWTSREFLRFEVKGHLLAAQQPVTIICQYDTTAIDPRQLGHIVAAHQFTVAPSHAGKNSVRRSLSQVIFDGMDEQLRALAELQEMSLKLTASLGLDEMLGAVIDAARTICRTDYAAISLLSESGELRIIKHHGLSRQYLNRRQLTRNDPSIEKLFATAEPVIVEDIERFAGLSPNYAAWKAQNVKSAVTLPLISNGKVFGIVGAGSASVRSYTQTEVDAMRILAAQASAAITNARLFDELSRADRAKDEFLSTLSHELRTPLTPILGWIHILRKSPEGDLLAQGLDAIERNARQQAGLINDLLDLTRIVSGKLELVYEPTSLTALVETAVDQFRPLARERSLNLDVAVPDGPFICDVDPVRLQQAVANLLNNAVKFTPDGGRVSVSFRVEAGNGAPSAGFPAGTGPPPTAVIEVADSGIGIEPYFLPHVFERFSQSQTGIDRRFGGLGLGLAITRAMVESHGGQVTAASEGLGRGSRFTVRLPVVTRSQANRGESFATPAGVAGRVEPLGLKVLVVEDSGDTADMLRMWLDSFGCAVEIAACAADGLDLAPKFRPDVVISDIGMPELDGYEFIRKLKAMPGFEQITAIALTGYAREEDRLNALAAGYDAHVAKPAEMHRLIFLLKKLAGA